MYRIIRQSLFSSYPGTKLMYNVVKGSVKAERAGLRGSMAIRKALSPGSQSTEAMRRLVAKKTKNSVSHEAARRTASEWSRTGVNNKLAKASQVLTNTGQVADRVVSKGVRSPISSLSNIGDNFSGAVSPSLAAAPIGTVGSLVEKVAKKSGSYKRMTRRLGKAYDQSKLSEKIRKAPSIVDIGNAVSKLPIPGITI